MDLIVAFFVCAGTRCEPVSVTVHATPAVFCGSIGPQITAAQWLGRHPDFRLAGAVECRTRGAGE